MEWARLYDAGRQPTHQEIANYVVTPYWETLAAYLAATYHSAPRLEYSACSMIPGWNVKYRAGGRALCTLYPGEGSFTCMVTAGEEAQLMLEALSPATRDAFLRSAPLRGVRWVLVKVESEAALEDVKLLLSLKRKPK